MFTEDIDAPVAERARERLLDLGPAALSVVELLALVIGTGTRKRSHTDVARAVLAEAGDTAGLAHLDARRLARQHGLGVAKAARISAALELGRRVATAERAHRPTIQSPAEAARIVGPELGAATEERLQLVLLDRRSRLMRTLTIYQGTVDGLAIHAADVLRPAIEARAHSFVLAHNHPSGDARPSAADIATTRQLVRAARVVGLRLREHLVIAGTTWSAIRAGTSGRWVSAASEP